jgi:hypothetical protein
MAKTQNGIDDNARANPGGRERHEMHSSVVTNERKNNPPANQKAGPCSSKKLKLNRKIIHVANLSPSRGGRGWLRNAAVLLACKMMNVYKVRDFTKSTACVTKLFS